MNHVPHILVVDDDSEIRQMLADYLQRNGLRVSQADGGRAMRALMDTHAVDLVVLDVMMPGEDGLSLCRNLRAGKHRAVPVVLLTARDDETDRIIGLEMGADDYVTKPFRVEEVVARIRAIVRRSAGLASSRLEIADLVLDTRTMQVSRDGVPINLTPQEYKLLAYLAHQRGRVVSQLEITEHLYAQDFERESNSIEVLVGRVRRRLGSDIIKTKRGFGYYMGNPAE